MKQSTKYNLLAILFFFLAAITLGGLGNAAVKAAHFDWFPFVVNLGVYGWGVYKLFKKGNEE
jgi:hypothetical protein